jgi:acetoin utilization deacetylase AcuC-like enzyme
MTTLYITHADCRLHEMGPGHPENPGRLAAINEELRKSGLLAGLRSLEAPLAKHQDLERVHHKAYVDLIFKVAPSTGYRQLDPDTAMNPNSLDAARRAAGAGILAIEEILAGRADTAFCAVRPCGHHATPDRSMGFCIFNNIAVAAAFALDSMGLERVAIVDFDVHHGNGTEDIFAAPAWRDRVLMTGLFQHPFYPYRGTDDPAPNMLNVPFPAGSGGEAVRQAVSQLWLPALDRFKPQLILISAGFDAHAEDPIGGMALIEDDYAWITNELRKLAARHAEGRIVSMLEGGYSLPALARSVAAHVGVLARRA